jgi:hypothetical protein
MTEEKASLLMEMMMIHTDRRPAQGWPIFDSAESDVSDETSADSLHRSTIDDHGREVTLVELLLPVPTSFAAFSHLMTPAPPTFRLHCPFVDSISL